MRLQPIACLVISSLLCASGAAVAQTAVSGSIAGVVKDTTGAVLPGVTVEAASPALIEKVRTALTDAQGQYKILDLRPGTYTVTFTLGGFNVVKREGLELATGFTAPANAEMKVGSISETVTVTGASPVVDVQNVRSQNVLSREVLDALPTAKTFGAFAALTVGATGAREVGGNKGEGFGVSFAIHGAPGDGKATMDGLPINAPQLSGATQRFHINQMAIQEVVLETGGKSAESETGGANISVVSKDGGNVFSGLFNVEYAGGSLQSSNLSDGLRARGLTKSNEVRQIYDVGGGLGGPIRKDRLWFYASHRMWGSQEYFASVFYNKLQHTLFYEPDLTRPANTKNYDRHTNLHLTWQATKTNKFTFTGVNLRNCGCLFFAGATRAPEAAVDIYFDPNNLLQANWSYPATNRLLFEGGGARRVDVSVATRPAGQSIADYSVVELSTGVAYGSMVSAANPTLGPNTSGWLNDYGNHGNAGYNSSRFAVSYITGSHAFKTGASTYSGVQRFGGEPNHNVQYTFRNRIPVSLTQIASPHRSEDRIKLNLGLFAQDQWTLRRLTLNLGLRFDYFNGYVPAQVRPGGEFVPELKVAPVYNLPNFKDVSPRLGAAYDLFGNGRSAVKVTLGRYMATLGTGVAQGNNPAEALGGTASRIWNDVNGNYVPDCELKNTSANGECGALSSSTFGTIVRTLRYADDARLGVGNRTYNWQGSASFQQELRPGMALTVGYYRTWLGNLTVTDNAALAPADYSPYCITAPKDARLPGGGGNQICGLFDIKPEKFGLVDNVVTLADHFGKRTQVYNGIDVVLNARFGKGGLVSGGVNTGHTVTDNCASPEFPAQFCRNVNPQTQVKFSGAYPLPWGLQASATLQHLPGINISATHVVTNAETLPSLGRNLGQCRGAATCTGTVTINLIEPNTVREPRQTQVDFRLAKNVRAGRVRLQPRMDIYNLFNAGDVQGLITRYGASWLNASDILAGRLFKFGGQIDF